MQDLAHYTSSGNPVNCIFLDFRKAFDKVDHRLLMHKLHRLRLHDDVLHWLKDFLKYRKQYVVLNGKKPDSVAAKPGVPQGLVLVPLLFSIFVNDFSQDIYLRILKFSLTTPLFTGKYVKRVT